MPSYRFILSSTAASNPFGGSALPPNRPRRPLNSASIAIPDPPLDTSLPRTLPPSQSASAIVAASNTSTDNTSSSTDPTARNTQVAGISPASPSRRDDDCPPNQRGRRQPSFDARRPPPSQTATRPSLLPAAHIVPGSSPTGEAASSGPPGSRHSLFPPSRSSVVHDQAQVADPFAATDPAVTTSPSASSSSRRPSHSHSRSSSVGIPQNPLRNLNRWSNSTASSKASASGDHHPIYHRRQRSASFSRPLSVGSIGHITTVQPSELTATPTASSNTLLASGSGSVSSKKTPRKLQKSRPTSIASGSPLRESPRAIRSRNQHSPRPPPPLVTLPPITALPSLEQEVRGGSASYTGHMTPQQPRPPHLRQLSSEDNIQAFYFGDATQPPSTVNRPASAQATIRQASPTLAMGRGARRTRTSTTMQYGRETEGASQPRGYTRSRPSNGKGSADSTRRDRASKPPSQKAMLSRALAKANTAVQLDNAGNIEGSRSAYTEACDLLHQVLVKTPGEDDKRKLEAIRETYTARIEELDQLLPIAQSPDSRPLPKRPQSSNNRRRSAALTRQQEPDEDAAFDGDGEDDAVIQTAAVSRIYNTNPPPVAEPRSVPSFSVPIPGSPTKVQHATDTRHGSSSLLTEQYTLQSSFSRSPRRDTFKINGSPTTTTSVPGATTNSTVTTTLLQLPTANPQYIPPPLSPRRIPSPASALEDPPATNGLSESAPSLSRMGTELLAASAIASAPPHGHARANSHESISWLDPIDESAGSTASSVHSRSSSLRIRRKHIRAASGATEAEFDAALDDAIEAAYDDGYEPMNSSPVEPPSYDNGDSRIAQTMRRVELAKQRVRESEQETMALERELALRRHTQQRQLMDDSDGPGNFLDAGDDSEEEERILEEMATGYAIEDFAFRAAKSRQVPRESDSSEFTNRTWHSSMASNPPTANTMLSTVTESTVIPMLAKGATSTMPPPPTAALPQLPPQSRPPTAPPQSPSRSDSSLGVRGRRMSGQNTKQLKIETSKLSPSTGAFAGSSTGAGLGSSTLAPAPASASIPQQSKATGYFAQSRQAYSAGPVRPGSSAAAAAMPFSKQSMSPGKMSGISPGDSFPPPNFPPPTPPIPNDSDSIYGRSGSPSSGKPMLRKNFSSSSLKSTRSRMEDGSDMSPGTPLSNQFTLNARLPALPNGATPMTSTFKERVAGLGGVGGLSLLESDFHSPTTPGSPNPIYTDAPVPLEPCPTDTMLRPFWLMRCLYQTLAHPRGGYLSNKLFVPNDVWKVKGVKLKNVEEKVANCEILSAALLKLARVDTIDADAVLEEMQSLEGVLEHVQNVLTRKLGHEVGVQSANSLFKEASAGGDGETSSGPTPRTTSMSSNSRSFSWRRLRPKNSSAGLSSNYSNPSRKESISEIGSKDGGTLASLPMTQNPTSKPTKRDVASAFFTGPNAHYMAALARLFDAAQSVDQIARQVEDPGLRHADKTQVGLELCTRHAAEFFAFYICRFVLSDVSLLLEKFIKRGSEWVLT